MITHLHVNTSGDDSLNGIAVIGRNIFVENLLSRPSCFSEIAEIADTLYVHTKIWS